MYSILPSKVKISVFFSNGIANYIYIKVALMKNKQKTKQNKKLFQATINYCNRRQNMYERQIR